MHDHAAESQSQLCERIMALEMLVTHLERTVQSLNETVCDQRKQLDSFERKLSQLTQEFGVLGQGVPEVRKPEDEKPPHY